MVRVLMIHPDKCTGCRNCELACAFSHDGSQFRLRTTRVHVYIWDREGFSVPMMCQQCEEAACLAVCPTGALHRNQDTGVVEWDENRCIRCRMCTLACPFGCAVYDAESSSILKCDLCSGEPSCAKACPNGALEFVDDTVATYSRKRAFSAKFKDAFQEGH